MIIFAKRRKIGIMNDFSKIFPGTITPDFRTSELPQSGSSRRNFVAENGSQKFIITENDNLRENESFISLSKIFAKENLNTPKIFAVSADRKSYVQEFLGEKTLSQILEEKNPRKTEILVKKTLLKLREMQVATEGKINFENAFEYPAYNEFPILHDLYYFKNFLADVLEIPYHRYALLQEFDQIVKKISVLEPKTIMLRDFQARNIMLNQENEVYFIDYQTAMKGPAMYDVVSFLYQAKANFPDEFKEKMVNFFLQNFENEEDRILAKQSLPYMVLIRYLQVLGAYGFRGIIQRKKHFLESLEIGIGNLYNFLTNWDEAENYPILVEISEKLKSVGILNH